jgi:hypothetical protein
MLLRASSTSRVASRNERVCLPEFAGNFLLRVDFIAGVTGNAGDAAENV